MHSPKEIESILQRLEPKNLSNNAQINITQQLETLTRDQKSVQLETKRRSKIINFTKKYGIAAALIIGFFVSIMINQNFRQKEIVEVKTLQQKPIVTQLTWLGFEMKRPNASLQSQLPSLPKETGFIVTKLISNKITDLQSHDIIWKFEDQLLVNEAQLASLIKMHKPGDEVTLDIFRGGLEKKIKLQLGSIASTHQITTNPSIDSLNHDASIPQLNSENKFNNQSEAVVTSDDK
jgi:PDZ domain